MSIRVWKSIASRRRSVAALASLCIALAAGPALALDGTWSASATSGALWGTASNWVGNIVGTGTGFTATFSPDIASDFTVDNNQQRAIGSLVFGTVGGTNSGNWLVSGSQITITNGNPATNATITVNSLGSVTISGTIASGTANNALLVKNGTGKLILSNTGNSISNKISITAGTLEVGNERVLGAAPGSYTADQLQISSGGTFRTTATATISANRGITIGSGGGTISVNGGALALATRVSGAGNTVTVTGPNALTLTNSAVGTNVNWDFASNSGLRTFFEGTNALGTGAVTVRNGVRLTSQNMTTGTITNAVTLASGAGLTARSSGGAQTYSNVSFPASGSVVFNRDDLATAGLTILSGAALSGVLTVDTSQFGSNAVGDVTLSGAFSGAGGLTKSGTQASGKLILAGGNTYTGDTTINTGTLALGAAGSIANSAAIIVASNAAFDVSAASGYTLGSAQTLRGAGTVVGNITASGTIAPGLSGTIGTLSFANDVTMGAGTIMDYQLNGANTTVGGVVNDLSAVTGNLILDGSLNVAEFVANSFQSATVGNSWRLFNYTGALTNNGLTLGTMPALSSGLEFQINTSTANQVNLVVVAAVPEPATVVLALVGLAFAGAGRLRRRSRLGS